MKAQLVPVSGPEIAGAAPAIANKLLLRAHN